MPPFRRLLIFFATMAPTAALVPPGAPANGISAGFAAPAMAKGLSDLAACAVALAKPVDHRRSAGEVGRVG